MAKRLYTSYFARSRHHPKAVAITSTNPAWAKDLMRCAYLAPKWSLVKSYKCGRITKERYTKEYLAMLNSCGKTPQQVADMLPEGAVLLCYENPQDFCHRHIAAEWLKQADVVISELP